MTTPKVIIIIPTYNEEEVIADTIAAIANERSQTTEFDIHVLVFDSASTDNTYQRVKNLLKMNPWLHLETESKKSGLGFAYFQAMCFAVEKLNADLVIEFDADLSHQPKYLIPMLTVSKTCDVVLGSRYVKNGSIPKDWGWHRKLISIFGNQLARFVLTKKYKDFTSGFRVTSRAALLEATKTNFLSNHYAYKLHLLWLLHKNGASIREYPIDFLDREKGKSKLPANSILDSLRVILLLRLFEFKKFFSSGKGHCH
ncbi:MAG: hypothetical protein A3E88_04730 [Legionellales bacterium RIFCSPHIGHO2_12_FULL_35_11]|nr:MAG: hypothetical protein A3E88_04730 [Legionellales bacterium RIFCSPHIGHO2_12_FULL_35_11]